ncbi:20963_t:CDS:2, partial [Cetraspora pellucida]
TKYIGRYSEILIVDNTHKTNIYKYLLISAVNIKNISNKKEVLASYQIVITWIEDEIFMSNKDQALQNNTSK